MGRQSKDRSEQREINWYEASELGKIYVSSEVIMYSIKDIAEMTGWSHNTVEKLFNDPSFPSIDYGKTKIVENHALMQFLSVRREKARNPYWRKVMEQNRRKRNG